MEQTKTIEQVEQLGHYTLRQTKDCFHLGEDSVALGGFATLHRGVRVCDLGCGSGVLGLLLLEREAMLTLTGIELHEPSANLAARNYAENGVNGAVITGDLRDKTLLIAASYDLIVSNPPWFPQNRGRMGGSDRCELTCTLEEVVTAAGRLLRNGGRFAIVHRPERLRELFSALTAQNMEPKRLQFVHYHISKPPSAILVEAVKQGRPGLAVLPPQIKCCKDQKLEE